MPYLVSILRILGSDEKLSLETEVIFIFFFFQIKFNIILSKVIHVINYSYSYPDPGANAWSTKKTGADSLQQK